MNSVTLWLWGVHVARHRGDYLLESNQRASKFNHWYGHQPRPDLLSKLRGLRKRFEVRQQTLTPRKCKAASLALNAWMHGT